MKCLIYCTMGKPYLVSNWVEDHEDYKPQRVNFLCDKKQALQSDLILNGKVVAEFECNKVEEIRFDLENTYFDNYYYMSSMNEPTICKKSCLTKEQLNNYLGTKGGYAIHIENLKVFDEPKNINTYKVEDRARNKEVKNLFGKNAIAFKWLEKAPQNMCKVYRLNNNGEDYDEYILISIRPEWVCKILNGEKTIEIRKRVLKEMLK